MSSQGNKRTLGRREFLKVLAVWGSLAAGLKLKAKALASSSSGDSPHRWGMVIDLSKCTGCGYCTLACRAHNDVPPSISWNRVTERDVNGQRVFLPQPCMHCEKAPCVDVCPVNASYHREDCIVMMDYDRCIGCRYCQVACPYNARSFNWEAFKGDNPAVPEWGSPEVERAYAGLWRSALFVTSASIAA